MEQMDTTDVSDFFPGIKNTKQYAHIKSDLILRPSIGCEAQW